MKGVIAFVMVAVIMGSAMAADETANIQSAQTSLDYTLTTFSAAVEKLAVENRELSALNDRLRSQLASLQEEHALLQRDEAKISNQFASLEGQYQKRMAGRNSVDQKISLIRQEALSLDNASARLEARSPQGRK